MEWFGLLCRLVVVVLVFELLRLWFVVEEILELGCSVGEVVGEVGLDSRGVCFVVGVVLVMDCKFDVMVVGCFMVFCGLFRWLKG